MHHYPGAYQSIFEVLLELSSAQNWRLRELAITDTMVIMNISAQYFTSYSAYSTDFMQRMK